MSDRRGCLFVISAPSGSGKTTLVRRLLGSLDDIGFSVSLTTRPVRGSERDGVDYHFVTEDVFRRKSSRESFSSGLKCTVTSMERRESRPT